MLLTHNRNYSQSTFSQQRGVALIIALFIVALVVTLSYFMMARLSRDTKRTTLQVRHTEAEFLAKGSLAWAQAELSYNLIHRRPKRLVDKMPSYLGTQVIKGYSIKTTIFDLQARFNLNNLDNPDAQADFKRLLKVLLPNMSEAKDQELVAAIADWISQSLHKNRFDTFYLSLPQPYHAAHRQMKSVSELRLIKGIDMASYRALLPYVAALPVPSTINVQTAPQSILRSLSDSMTDDIATALVNIRAQSPFVSIDEFLNQDVLKNRLINAQKIAVVSDYFLVQTEIAMQDQYLILYTVLQRKIQKNKVTFVTLLQSQEGI